MNIVPKVYISPLLASQKLFTDIHGKPNACLETNPSLYIDSSGNTTVLIRRVNYRKFHNRSFSIYQNQSISDYVIARGHISQSFDTLDFEPLTYIYDRPTYSTYWRGLEDIRFIDATTVLVTVPECNPSGQPCIFQATLTNSTVHTFLECKPNNIEKNWMPFLENDEPFVIYSVNPLTRKGIQDEALTTILDQNEELEGYHGSTNGILITPDTHLFLIHTSRERSYHRWLKMCNGKSTWSKEFIFFKNAYIEFPCSLALYQDRLFVSLGLNDDKAFIVEVPLAAASEFE